MNNLIMGEELCFYALLLLFLAMKKSTGPVLGSVLGFIYISLTVADFTVNTLQCQ